MSETKVCTKCKQSKPATVEYFYSRGNRLISRCKLCWLAACKAWKLTNAEKVRVYQKAWAIANADKMRARSKAWYLANIDKTKSLRNAWKLANSDKARASSKAWRLANPEKQRAATKAWSSANPDKRQSAAKAYRKANPEKIRATNATRRSLKRNASGSHTAADIKRLFVEQAGRCGYCSASLASGYHVDHVVPLSRGGSNAPSNLCLACPRCNFSKGAKLLSEMG